MLHISHNTYQILMNFVSKSNSRRGLRRRDHGSRSFKLVTEKATWYPRSLNSHRQGCKKHICYFRWSLKSHLRRCRVLYTNQCRQLITFASSSLLTRRSDHSTNSLGLRANSILKLPGPGTGPIKAGSILDPNHAKSGHRITMYP